MTAKRKLTLLLAPIVAIATMGLVGTAFAPALLVHAPLVLIALNPMYTNLVLVVSSVGALPFFAVAVTRLFLSDPFYFLIGREYGDAAIEWVERRSPLAGKMARVVEKLFERAGPLVLFLVPGGLVCVLAGASHMRARTFVAINLAGTLTLVALVRAFGHALADPIEVVRDFVAANILLLTALSVLLVIASTVIRQRRARLSVDRTDVVPASHPRDDAA